MAGIDGGGQVLALITRLSEMGTDAERYAFIESLTDEDEQLRARLANTLYRAGTWLEDMFGADYAVLATPERRAAHTYLLRKLDESFDDHFPSADHTEPVVHEKSS